MHEFPRLYLPSFRIWKFLSTTVSTDYLSFNPEGRKRKNQKTPDTFKLKTLRWLFGTLKSFHFPLRRWWYQFLFSFFFILYLFLFFIVIIIVEFNFICFRWIVQISFGIDNDTSLQFFALLLQTDVAVKFTASRKF